MLKNRIELDKEGPYNYFLVNTATETRHVKEQNL